MALEQAHLAFLTRLDVPEDQWGTESACAGWSIGELVDHVIGGNAFTSAVLDGQSANDALAGAKRSTKLSVGDRYVAYVTSARTMVGQFARNDLRDRTFSHIVGDVSWDTLASMRINDLTLHAWDLARSLRGNEQLDPQLVEYVWSDMAARAPEIASSGMFGPRYEVSDDAPLQVRLLGLTGRRT